MIKQIIKESKITGKIYKRLAKEKHDYVKANKFKCKYTFIDRKKNFDKLCIVLAGYKDFLYDATFGRLKEYTDNDIDVCIISSGLYSATINKICETNDWSYLSTRENNVSLVQNVAINLHKKAKYIFKLDEDIFVTRDYFKKMLNAYKHACNGNYIPGVIAPLLNINGYAHMRILKKLDLEKVYEDKFESPKYAAGIKRKIESDPNAAKFMWGEGGFVPSIDKMNEQFGQEALCELPCPIRFSIGAIMFERSFWRDMGYFDVNRRTSNLGADEVQLCNFCMQVSRPIMISENIVVGHLSFGSQNKEMKEYFLTNPSKFVIE